jgi:hypothetical protein
MLSEQDKKDMLEDALSEERRKNFKTVAKLKKAQPPLTPKEYLDFLADVQKICGEFPVSHRRINTAGNKL